MLRQSLRRSSGWLSPPSVPPGGRLQLRGVHGRGEVRERRSCFSRRRGARRQSVQGVGERRDEGLHGARQPRVEGPGGRELPARHHLRLRLLRARRHRAGPRRGLLRPATSGGSALESRPLLRDRCCLSRRPESDRGTGWARNSDRRFGAGRIGLPRNGASGRQRNTGGPLAWRHFVRGARGRCGSSGCGWGRPRPGRTPRAAVMPGARRVASVIVAAMLAFSGCATVDAPALAPTASSPASPTATPPVRALSAPDVTRRGASFCT